MKKLIASIIIVFAYFLNPFSSVAFAGTLGNVGTCPSGTTFTALCNLTGDNLSTVLGNAFNIAFIVAILIAVAYLIFGGIKWITSRGEKTDVEAARNHIVAAIVGLIIVFLAFFIINIVLKMFGVTGSSFTIPTLTQ